MNRNAILARLAIVIIVTVGIFYVSAGHIVEVAMRYGNPFSTAIVYPLAVDGVILVSGLTMAARVGVSKETRRYAQLARYCGFAATLGANAAHSPTASIIAIAVNIIPAVMLILMMETVISSVKMTPAARQATRKAPSKPTTTKPVKLSRVS